MGGQSAHFAQNAQIWVVKVPILPKMTRSVVANVPILPKMTRSGWSKCPFCPICSDLGGQSAHFAQNDQIWGGQSAYFAQNDQILMAKLPILPKTPISWPKCPNDPNLGNTYLAFVLEKTRKSSYTALLFWSENPH